MTSLPLLSLVLLAIVCFEVKGKIMLYGEGVKSRDGGKEFLEQLCPKPNSADRKYVRIKTFNGKYVYARPTHKGDHSYLQTRCCEVKDALGRKDVTEPGRRTTFLIHCLKSNDQDVVRFELLHWWKDTPSGYFLYADYSYNKIGIWANKLDRVKEKYHYRFNFKIERVAGAILSIRTQGRPDARRAAELSQWLSFDDNGDGHVLAYKHPFNYKRYEYPSMAEFYTLEAVPSGCVKDAVENNKEQSVWAAPAGTDHEECESVPDRCYWTDGWDIKYRKMRPGTYYYNRDSKCSWWRFGDDQQMVPQNRKCIVSGKTITDSVDECEAAHCCYDYKRKQCYKPL